MVKAQQARNLKPLLIGVAIFVVLVAAILTAMLILSHRTGSDDTQVFVRRISSRNQVRVSGLSSLKTIAYTDFAFVVKFNGTVALADQENTLEIHMRSGDVWSDVLATVQVFAQEGTLRYVYHQFWDFSFPESNPSNELSITVEILDNARILVSSSSGNFPAASQIVLFLHWGENTGYVARVFTASSPS